MNNKKSFFMDDRIYETFLRKYIRHQNKYKEFIMRRERASRNYQLLYKLYYSLYRNGELKVPQSQFSKITDLALQSFLEVEKYIDPRLVKQCRREFIQSFRNFFKTSKILYRFLEKPRGYPGDFWMFEMVYDRTPVSIGLGKYLDNYVLNNQLTKSIVFRKNSMRKFLNKYIKNSSEKRINIMNVGCGSSREVFELNIPRDKSIFYCGVDQDDSALKYSKESLKLKKNIEFVGINKTIVGILNTRDSRLPQFDLIYSMGVVDYFLDNALEKFINSCLSLLKPGGALVFASCSDKNASVYSPMPWFYDWYIYIKNSSALKRMLLKNINCKKIDVFWESSRQVFFMALTTKRNINE